ncbi:unnamed protein product, partial [Amoebophrya sp. A25]|eukprot:GSA25T00005287001.1
MRIGNPNLTGSPVRDYASGLAQRVDAIRRTEARYDKAKTTLKELTRLVLEDASASAPHRGCKPSILDDVHREEEASTSERFPEMVRLSPQEDDGSTHSDRADDKDGLLDIDQAIALKRQKASE